MLLWSRLGMQPDFALALFHEIDALTPEAPYGSVLLDLSDNQLGTMGEEGLLKLLRVVQRHDWLVVRFGSEVNAVALGRALNRLGLGRDRVYIDRPWRNAAELSGLAASLKVTTVDAVANSSGIAGIAGLCAISAAMSPELIRRLKTSKVDVWGLGEWGG